MTTDRQDRSVVRVQRSPKWTIYKRFSAYPGRALRQRIVPIYQEVVRRALVELDKVEMQQLEMEQQERVLGEMKKTYAIYSGLEASLGLPAMYHITFLPIY